MGGFAMWYWFGHVIVTEIEHRMVQQDMIWILSLKKNKLKKSLGFVSLETCEKFLQPTQCRLMSPGSLPDHCLSHHFTISLEVLLLFCHEFPMFT